MTLNPVQSNQLKHSSSPYLLQHADNPVHWQEWNKATLQSAAGLNKPILLSIGYAACHWCHVMAHESFEDQVTAELMNELFINIKVDREERPDIDQIYMSALHALGEQGGWPLTMFLKPDGSPFWGGTYFPPVPSHGRPAFREVLSSIHKTFEEKIDDVDSNAKALTAHLRNLSKPQRDTHLPNKYALIEFSDKVLQIYDAQNGGMKGAPKFPNAPFMEVWARAAKHNENSHYARAFIHTIKKISLGGIYDHLAGGIARYSVDDKWLVPHFEKMLYDNAHYLRHLLWCWKLTEEIIFRVRIEETINWLKQEMLLEEKAFASSLDADSEGVEGKFYVWNHDEIKSILNNHEIFCSTYDISAPGNWENTNILNLSSTENYESTFTKEFFNSRNLLLEERAKRIRPEQDDKILTDWNGYLIRALTEIAATFENQDWLELAQNAYHFITESNGEALFHSTRAGNTVKPALATDYASMLNAALSLYEATFDKKYLAHCEAWFSLLEKNYLDDQGGYYLTSIEATDLLVRPRADQDEANPSASSQILEAMIRYANLSGDIDILKTAENLVKNQEAISKVNRYGMTGYMNALDSYYNHMHILICGPDSAEKDELVKFARMIASPAKTISVSQENNQSEHNGIKLPNISGKPCMIICSGQTCSAPIYNENELRDYLSKI